MQHPFLRLVLSPGFCCNWSRHISSSPPDLQSSWLGFQGSAEPSTVLSERDGIQLYHHRLGSLRSLLTLFLGAPTFHSTRSWNRKSSSVPNLSCSYSKAVAPESVSWWNGPKYCLSTCRASVTWVFMSFSLQVCLFCCSGFLSCSFFQRFYIFISKIPTWFFSITTLLTS